MVYHIPVESENLYPTGDWDVKTVSDNAEARKDTADEIHDARGE